MGFCANCGGATEGMKRLCNNCSALLGSFDNEAEPAGFESEMQNGAKSTGFESEMQNEAKSMGFEHEMQNVVSSDNYTPDNQDENINNVSAEENVSYNESTNNANMNFNYNNVKSDSNMEVVDYFKVMGLIFIKPFTTIKERAIQLSNIKNSGIIALIMVAIITIMNLIKNMFNAVVVKSYSFWEDTYSTKIEFSNLEHLNYLEILGGTFITWIAIIAIIAGVYYIAGLIIKKATNFPKMLGIATLSVIPFVASLLILSPILSLVYSFLGTLSIIIGFVYTLIILYEVMNAEAQLEGNEKCYYNLICLSIIISASTYIYMNIVLSSISSISSLMNIF